MGRTIAIMQPYIFPYIGYFQLVNCVDKFIFYNDVTFIKQGWINRNKFTMNGEEVYFTVPITKQSSSTYIYDAKINRRLFEKFKQKFYKGVHQSYGKAPFFEPIFKIIQGVFELETDSMDLMAQQSVKLISKYLGLNTEFDSSRDLYENDNLNGQNRVIDILRQEKADHYMNPIGGKVLYSSDIFLGNNLDLSFVKVSDNLKKLLIIDILMYHDIEHVKNILNQYDIIK